MVLDGKDFHRIGLIVGTEDEVVAGELDVFDGTGAVLLDGVHVELAFAVWLEGIVMAIDEDRGPGKQAGVHAHAFAGVKFDEHKALPLIAIAFGLSAEAAQEVLLEFEDLLHVHVHDQRLVGGDIGGHEQDVLEIIFAGGGDGGALADLVRIEQVEHGEVLDVEHFVHALDAESPLTIEEVGDMSLLEAGLLGEAHAGKAAFVDALP